MIPTKFTFDRWSNLYSLGSRRRFLRETEQQTMRIYVKLSKTCWKIEQIFRNYSQFTLSSLRRVIRFGALKFWNKKCVTEKWHFSKVLFLIQVRLPWTVASPVNKLQFHRKRSTILKITNIQKWNLLNKALFCDI